MSVAEYLVRMWHGAAAGDRQALLFWMWMYASLCCGYGAWYLLRIRRWPAVAGTLRMLEQRQIGVALLRAERTYRMKADYEYEVDGRRYRGSWVTAWPLAASGALRGLLELQRLGVHVDGDRVRVLHHPTRHHRAFLVRPGWFGIGFLLVLALLPPLLYFAHYGLR